MEPTKSASASLVDASIGAGNVSDDRALRVAAAEASATRAVSLAPDNALAHMALGVAYILSKRAAQGIAECEQALALDRNLTDAHAAIALGKIFIGRPAETEGHIREALRLSPRDIFAFRWMAYVGIASWSLAPTRKQSRGWATASRPIAIFLERISILLRRLPCAAL